MLGNKISHLLSPTINYYESNEPHYFPDIYQMTEETTNFENLINKMKENSKKKSSFKKCSNANCENPFSSSSNCINCHSCGQNYCPNCIKKCAKCEDDICLFCVSMEYDKYKDAELCPNCAKNQ